MAGQNPHLRDEDIEDVILERLLKFGRTSLSTLSSVINSVAGIPEETVRRICHELHRRGFLELVGGGDYQVPKHLKDPIKAA